MTEGEARQRWCPFARLMFVYGAGTGDVGAVAGTVNRVLGSIPENSCCIASDCMAWVWAEDYEIELTNGHIIVLDAVDATWANSFGWWWDGHYARSDEGRLHVLLVERLCGPIPEGQMVDHIDGDTHNYRRDNLRLATSGENAANAASRGGASKYRGVHRNKKRWSAQISKDGERECLGTFDTEEEAAAAYDEAAKRLHGKFARLNLAPIQNSGRHGYCGLARNDGKAGKP